MFEKNMRLAYLLDFYGDALDRRTRSIMQSYYEDDLSLSEIAEGENISRQGVRHIIKKGEEQLEFFEERLGLAAHQSELYDAAKKLSHVKEILEQENNADYSDCVSKLEEVISTILNKGI
jgi:predicted DNA-binding protein YlxM (UPF0122 family)